MTLPIPHIQALEHSQKLCAFIREEIASQGGHMTFARFMELALYAPGLGYYSAGSHKLGKGGDFVTAPEITPLFSQCLAHVFQQIFSTLPVKNILELGAGSGIFAKDALLELEKQNNLPDAYFILEVSADLRSRQKTLFEKHCPQLLNRIHWLDTLPHDFIGIIFANEVMDALPVHFFELEKNLIKERCVTWEDNQFTWKLTSPSAPLTDRLDILPKHLSAPYLSEINLLLPSWINALADSLKQGMILLFDYGYGRDEYYRPDRRTGTFKCFYQHHHHDNPFLYPGLQDLTAHVDFTTVAESATDAGLDLAGFTTQGAFLLASGLLDLNNKNLMATEQYQLSQAIKILTLPSQMGELIKVIGFTRDIDVSLEGFRLQDRRRDL
jgi:SAM-dependent MidA family methyltransferase